MRPAESRHDIDWVFSLECLKPRKKLKLLLEPGLIAKRDDGSEYDLSLEPSLWPGLGGSYPAPLSGLDRFVATTDRSVDLSESDDGSSSPWALDIGEGEEGEELSQPSRVDCLR